MLTSTARRRIAAGLLTTLALAGSALVTEPASAATTQNVVYSTDGGATWSTSPTVAPGGTVIVRQWFDNTDNLHATAASETTTLPTGFTQSGATQVCLNPSTTAITSPNGTELECATANSGAVWSGSNLTVSPTAGLFGQSASDTSGILAAGRKRYLSLDQCRWQGTGNLRAHVLVDTADFTTNTGAGNAPTTSNCVKVTASPWATGTGINAVNNFSLFARRYVNLHQCRWRAGDNNIQTWNQNASDTNYLAGSNTSNNADASASCTAGAAPFSSETASRGAQALDILTNRYLNLHQCRWADPGSENRLTSAINATTSNNFVSGTKASNTPDAAVSCTTTSTWTLNAPTTGLQAIDLLDTTRGKGYVQYSMTAPANPTAEFCTANANVPAPEAFDQDTALTSSAGTVPASGTISVDWAQNATACDFNIGNLVDPTVGAIVAGTLALAGAGVASYRRRTSIA